MEGFTQMKKVNYSKEHLAYIKKVKNENLLVYTLRVIIILLILGLWELLATLNVIDSFITSCPSKIFITIYSLLLL